MSELESRSIEMVMTRKGLDAIATRVAAGAKLPITHIAFGNAGTGGYAPTAERTALKNEIARVPIAPNGTRLLGDGRVLFQCALSDVPSFFVREVGIISEDGTLFAIWSDPAGPYFEKQDGITQAIAFTVIFGSFDTNHLTFETAGPEVNILINDDIDRLSLTTMRSDLRWLRQYERDLIAPKI